MKKNFIDKKGKNTFILDTQKIRKREAATMSNYQTFEKYDVDIDTYVLKEVVRKMDWLNKFITDGEVGKISEADFDELMVT